MSFWIRWLRLLNLGPFLRRRVPPCRSRKKPRRTFLTVEYLEERTVPSAMVWTNKPDYAPGSNAVFYGSGFQPGEQIEIQVTHIDGKPDVDSSHQPFFVTDGGAGDLDGIVNGRFATTWYVSPDNANSTLELTATGLTSHEVAETTFTDSIGTPSIIVTPKSNTSTTTSTTLPLTASVAQGNTVILAVALPGTSGNVTVNDTKGDSYSLTQDFSQGSFIRTLVFTAPVTSASGLTTNDTITVTYPSSAVSAITAFQVSGLVQTSPVDQAANTNSFTFGGTVSSPSVTTTSPNELLLGVVAADNNNSGTTSALAAAGSYTAVGTTVSAASGNTGVNLLPEYQIVSSTNTYAATETVNNGNGAHWTAAILTYKGAVTISPTALPAATYGNAYSQALTASGGTAPYTFAVAPGSLPSGLTLSSSGVLSGTPTAAGSYNFTVAATDNTGTVGSQAYTFTVNLGLSPGNGNQSTLPLSAATAGTSYSQQISANGGGVSDSYSYALASGSLPAGLTLSSGGLLSGTPTAAGSFSFTVNATDTTSGAVGSQAYSVSVGLGISPSSLLAATVGISTNQTISAIGGTGACTFTVSSGSLPAGLTLSSNGVLSGTPTAGGSFNFTVTAKDSATSPNTSSTVYSLTVNPPNVTINQTSLPAETVGTAYNQTVSASGGTAPYTFTLLPGGTLPTGLTLSAAGLLSGTPSTAGPFTFTLEATDSSTGTGAPTLPLRPTRLWSISVSARPFSSRRLSTPAIPRRSLRTVEHNPTHIPPATRCLPV